MLNRTITILFSLLFSIGIQAQWISINDVGATPHESAALDISTTKRGVLVPRMDASDRLGISSPAKGLLVFQNDGLIGFYFYNGTAWDTLGGASTITNISNVTNISNSGIAVIRDLKGTGIDGGDFTSGDWRQRDLNDHRGDSSFISLGTNSFTLDSGTYVIQASAPAYRVDEHQLRLFNSTEGVVEAVGIVVFAGNFSSLPSLITSVVSVTASTETFILEHRCQNSRNTDGLGRGASWGESVFSQVTITKL